jgi:hypothetical protein
MPKEFYTERDIEDLFKRGVMSLEVNEDVALTELAYEKANRLGLKLVQGQPDNPPSAPVRPYLSSQKQGPSSGTSAAAPAFTPSAPPEQPSARSADEDLPGRIRTAVIAKLGNQVDPALLDVIIQRVLKSTGVK